MHSQKGDGYLSNGCKLHMEMRSQAADTPTKIVMKYAQVLDGLAEDFSEL